MFRPPGPALLLIVACASPIKPGKVNTGSQDSDRPDGETTEPGDSRPPDSGSLDSGPADSPFPDSGETGGAPPLDRPNILVIYGEARGWTSTSVQVDEGREDSRSALFSTPNLEALAAEGMTFSDFYAPSPRCMPSRAAFLTGQSPARLHMTFVGEGASDGVPTGDVVPPDTLTTLPTSVVTLPWLLQEAGYATAHYGKWHVGDEDPSIYGFDDSDGPTTNKGPAGEEHPNPAEAYGTVERGAAFMSAAVAEGRPFYLQISHYGGKDEIDSMPETHAAEAIRLEGADPEDIDEAAVVADMDLSLGALFAALEDLGVAEETYVIFTSDHGRAGHRSNEPLTEGKGSVWEGGIRVPLLVRGPGVPAGSHSHARASQVDLLPTLAARVAGTPPLPPEVEGGDLGSIWTGGEGAVTRPSEDFVVHFPHYDKDPIGPATALIRGDDKLIYAWEDGSLRLYDLSTDISEENDRAAEEPERAAELQAEMDAWLEEVGAQLPGHL